MEEIKVEGRQLFCHSHPFLSFLWVTAECNVYQPMSNTSWSYSVFDGGSTLKQDSKLDVCLVLTWVKAGGNTTTYSDWSCVKTKCRSYKSTLLFVRIILKGIKMEFLVSHGNQVVSLSLMLLFFFSFGKEEPQKDLFSALAWVRRDIISPIVNCGCTTASFVLIYKRHIHFITHW